MRIDKVQIFRYDLPLCRPLRLRGLVLDTRAGLIVRVEERGGAWGCGEAAPLPGWSEEKLEDVTAEATRAARSITGCTVPLRRGPLSDRFERWLLDHHLSASLSCGLQGAVVDMAARAAGLDLPEFFGAPPIKSIPINGLLLGNTEELAEEAQALCRSGYRVLKLKVGRGEPEREARLVRLLWGTLGENATLRLDANRAWDYDTAVAFTKEIGDCRLDYIEEPLRDPSRLVEFSARTGAPVALDETVAERGFEDLEQWRGVKAVVLKPMLLGGFECTMWMARRALNLGIIPVLSAAFESGVGLAAVADLAATLNQPEVAVGLDTYRWLAADTLAERLDMTRGELNLNQANRARDSVRFDRLRELHCE